MKLGFSLKKVKKNGFHVQRNDDEGSNRNHLKQAFGSTDKKNVSNEIYITKFDASSSVSSKPPELVIPLIKENQSSKKKVDEKDNVLLKETESIGNDATDGETETARAILAELEGRINHSNQQKSTDNNLVIAMKSGTIGSDDILVKRNIGKNQRSRDGMPILFQNAVPGMEKLDSVTAKYQFDVSMRPQELHVHSDAYEKVPVEEFGSALLRGMGWKGTKDDETNSIDIQPRHRLLGLGAKTAPTISGDRYTKRVKITHVDNAPVKVKRDCSNHTHSPNRPSASIKKLANSRSRDVESESNEKYQIRNERHKCTSSSGQRGDRRSNKEHRRDEQKRREERKRSGNRRNNDKRKK